MNINVKIRNKTKLVEKLRGYTYKIIYMSIANYRRLQNLVQIQVETFHFDQND